MLPARVNTDACQDSIGHIWGKNGKLQKKIAEYILYIYIYLSIYLIYLSIYLSIYLIKGNSMKATHNHNHVQWYRQCTTISPKLKIQQFTLSVIYLQHNFVSSVQDIFSMYTPRTERFLFRMRTQARSVNPLHDQLIENPQGPHSQDPRSIYLPLRLVQVRSHIGKWRCSRVVMLHQIYGCPLEKSMISKTQAHILWGGVPPKKRKISRNPRSKHWISRSPLHKTRRWVPPKHRSEY